MSTQSKSRTSPELIQAARAGLIPTSAGGWLGGFSNLFRKELGEWFGTRQWLLQSLLWLVVINGMMAFVLFVVPNFDSSEIVSAEEFMAAGLELFFGFATIFGSIGMVILAQDEIIKEKQSGTAAWVLSKPIARPAFILTKIFSNMVGALVIILGVPALVAYGEISIKTGMALPVLPYIYAVGVAYMGLVFYLTLTIMLGTLFEQRGPVLAIAAGVLLGGQIFAYFLPQIGYVLPVNIDRVAGAIAMSQPLPQIAVSKLASTALLSLAFSIVALVRFSRDEF
jgi:ABC-2 type transport system permease protein